MRENERASISPQKLSFEIKRPNLNSEVIIGKNILENVASLVDLSNYTQFVIITEKNIWDRFGPQLKKGLSSTSSQKIHVFDVKGGEINKTEDNANEIMAGILALKNPPVDHQTLLLAFGGGMIGDMTGYIAGKSLRGLDYLQIPTTLLAMVDASLGGKTGVDHNGITNMIGLFHLPKATIMDIATLESLSDREFKSGMGELVKHAFLYPKLFELMSNMDLKNMRQNDPQLINMLKLSAQYKMSVVGQDFEEKTGVRKELNLGHTIGRALETATGLTRFSHGEAVSIGTAVAIMISNLKGLISERDMEVMLSFIRKFGLPTTASNIDLELLWQAISHDKKSVGGEPRFVLLEGVGKPKIDCRVDKEVINQALKQFLEI